MGEHKVAILHVSDLHERNESDWRRRRVLGRAWFDCVDAFLDDGPIDLICFTGDLANSGRAEEYAQLTPFVEEMLARAKVPSDRLFVIPGNHDINRAIAEHAWAALRTLGPADATGLSTWMAGGRPVSRMEVTLCDQVLERQAAYRAWVRDNLRRPELLPSLHPRLGYRVAVTGLGVPFQVVGLDSAWMAGNDHDSGKLWLTDDQVGLLTDGVEGFTLALVHHPLADLADGPACRRLLAERASLLLRGHMHEAELALVADPDRSLREFAAGALYESDRYKNSCQRIDLTLDEKGELIRFDARIRSWSLHGHWHDDGGIYRNAPNGRFRWPAAEGTEALVNLCLALQEAYKLVYSASDSRPIPNRSRRQLELARELQSRAANALQGLTARAVTAPIARFVDFLNSATEQVSKLLRHPDDPCVDHHRDDERKMLRVQMEGFNLSSALNTEPGLSRAVDELSKSERRWQRVGFADEAAFVDRIDPSVKALASTADAMTRQLLLDIAAEPTFTLATMLSRGYRLGHVTDAANALLLPKWAKWLDDGPSERTPIELTEVGRRCLLDVLVGAGLVDEARDPSDAVHAGRNLLAALHDLDDEIRDVMLPLRTFSSTWAPSQVIDSLARINRLAAREPILTKIRAAAAKLDVQLRRLQVRAPKELSELLSFSQSIISSLQTSHVTPFRGADELEALLQAMRAVDQKEDAVSDVVNTSARLTETVDRIALRGFDIAVERLPSETVLTALQQTEELPSTPARPQGANGLQVIPVAATVSMDGNAEVLDGAFSAELVVRMIAFAEGVRLMSIDLSLVNSRGVSAWGQAQDIVVNSATRRETVNLVSYTNLASALEVTRGGFVLSVNRKFKPRLPVQYPYFWDSGGACFILNLQCLTESGEQQNKDFYFDWQPDGSVNCASAPPKPPRLGPTELLRLQQQGFLHPREREMLESVDDEERYLLLCHRSHYRGRHRGRWAEYESILKILSDLENRLCGHPLPPLALADRSHREAIELAPYERTLTLPVEPSRPETVRVTRMGFEELFSIDGAEIRLSEGAASGGAVVITWID